MDFVNAGYSSNNIAIHLGTNLPCDKNVRASPSTICSGSSSTITLDNSDIGVQYTLRNNGNNAVVDGPISGTGNTITFNTGNLTSTTTFNILAERGGTSGAMLFQETASSYSTLSTFPLNVATTTGGFDFSVEFWLKFNDNIGSNIAYIDILGYHDNSGFIEVTDAGRVYYRLGGSNKARTVAGSYPMDGLFHHIALVYDPTLASGARHIIYIDGVPATLDLNNNLTVGFPTTPAFYIGRSGNDPFYTLDGVIDELRIWSTARTSSEINSNKNIELVGNESGLVAYYNYNAGSGTVANDVTPNGHNTTLVNTTNANWVTRPFIVGSLVMTNTPTVTVNYAPATPGAISGTTTICSGTTNTYSVAIVAGADSYTWTLPGAWIGTSTTNTISATTSINSGNITVTAANTCGTSSAASQAITVNIPTTGTDIISSCNAITWIDGNTYSSSNNTATFVLTNAAGCDSTVTLNYTKLAATTGTDVITTCNDITWIDGNTYSSSNNTATFVLTNAAGCDSTVTLNYTKLAATTGTDVISSCGPITWIDGNTYTTSNNIATFVLTNAAGCDSTVTLNLTVALAIDVTTNTSAETITANATGATYQWIDCDNANAAIAGETNASYTATTNGNFAVIVTQGLCSDTSACVAITSVGIKNISLNNLISIQPNPNNGSFTIKAPTKGTYTLVNELGQIIQSFELNNTNNYSVSVNELATGVYFVIGNDNNFRSKIIVTK